MAQADAWRMIRRRGRSDPHGDRQSHLSRRRVAAYLENGGTL